MAVITFVVPPVRKNVFSGGLLCIFEYARGLRTRGHDVHLLPLLPSSRPAWFEGDYGNLVGVNGVQAVRRLQNRGGLRRVLSKQGAQSVLAELALAAAPLLPADLQRGFHLRHVRESMPAADVTVATSFESALPVRLYGRGRVCYFLQHFEPYFAVDHPDPTWAEYEARASYRLGLDMICNSPWLQGEIFREAGQSLPVCGNAIDHAIFAGEPRLGTQSRVAIISYGGRKATWKGFREMAEAMAAARRRLPDADIRWLVYGDCLLPPDNSIASYESLGFLSPRELAAAYRQADMLLSASWYESFPLFPLEAMASGIAVITSGYGTEEFAIHGETAEVVQARNVGSITESICRLVRDPAYRQRLAIGGRDMARRFTWDAAVGRMEGLLLASPAS